MNDNTNKRMILYKYANADSTLRILKGVACSERGFVTLKYTAPKEFDDIFECRHIFPVVDDNMWDDADYGQVSAINPASEQYDLLNAFGENVKNTMPIDDATEAILEDKVVCCFSQRWDNVLMWSLYADKYKGCVIGFDSAFFDPKELFQVRYVSGNTSIELSDAMQLANWRIITKFSDWAWQEEWRNVKSRSNLCDTNNYLNYYDRHIVKEIYFGFRTDENVKIEILRLAGLYHWKVRRIEKSWFEEGKLDSSDL